MTQTQYEAANLLLKCTFLPGSYDKRFVGQLPIWKDREMTPGGRYMLTVLLRKYRKQIGVKEADKVSKALLREETDDFIYFLGEVTKARIRPK